MNRGSIGKDDVEIVDQTAHVEHILKPSLVTQIGDFRVVGLTPEDADFYNNYPEDKRKRVFHKVDKRLIPMLAVLYLICHIDRANIGNAKIEGMVQDLKMTGLQYNTVLSIFFIPYVVLEVPSNILLKRFKRPSVYLGLLVSAWGIVMTCTGLVQNFAGLMTTRVLLGALEAGFFPGAIYLCSYWYMPRELALRISYFYCASALSGAFSGLLAAAIAKMDGIAGLEGWRWIFILEGLASVVLGVACFFLLIDTPALAKRWLSPEEIRYLELSMFVKQGGTSTGESGFKWRDLKVVLMNWRIYVQAYLLFCQSALSYGTKFTLPTITKAMGFSSTNAQLTSAPPYIAGAISAIVFARLSDRFYWRMPFVCIPMVFVVVAYSIILSLNGALEAKKGVAYFAVVLSVIGIYPIQPGAASWNANNIAPASRRAMGIALVNCVGNVGGILGSFMYIEKESPKYTTGFGLSLALGGVGFLVALFLEWTYKMGNAKKARIADDARVNYTEEELFDMGDKSPLFNQRKPLRQVPSYIKRFRADFSLLSWFLPFSFYFPVSHISNFFNLPLLVGINSLKEKHTTATMTTDASTTPSESQLTGPGPTSPFYGMYGHYWKSNRDVPPTKWLQESKKLCACDAHQASQWPMEHALITIPRCAYKCPYCPKFDTLDSTEPQVVKLRAHIKRKSYEFLGFAVTPARVTKARVPKP
ncbi:hypothetical protein DTO013E5_6059 [Penicillium roqueforti]|nr:hypothetical protein CBS147372_9098 [Penicillium roqueforti]KAI2710688.1 hypothetical protein CBS147354_8528 [Penicillium roqueforti]KAI2737039.1 hypothetical protein DTO012A1_7909 [Penicillium roqueforti]KAI2746096.1 hypothetical protein DTO013F2_7104 [Penicillium roqueforti]KAI2770270.1 hypothetical protein DTO012A8_4898 [Penicillium roqueforti]